MRNRTSFVLCWAGIAILIVSGGWPYSLKLLHKFGILQGWDGFGLFVTGLSLMPWLAGLGVILLAFAAWKRKRGMAH